MKGDTPYCQSLESHTDNIISIMRDIADGRKNMLGDYWSLQFCNDAANEIARLQKELQSKRKVDEG